MRSLLWAILAFALFSASVSARKIPWVTLSIPKFKRNRQQSSAVTFDKLGTKQSMDSSYKVMAQSTPIIALRTCNATIVAYFDPFFNTSKLQTGIGSQHFNSLADSTQHVVVTGLVGDCRLVVRYAKQVAVNHTAEFGCLPTGNFIAQKLSAHVQKIGREGYLTCHSLIIDSRPGVGTIHEVSAVGAVSEVRGAVAGGPLMQEMKEAREEAVATEMQSTESTTDSTETLEQQRSRHFEKTKVIIDKTLRLAKSTNRLGEEQEEPTAAPPQQRPIRYHLIHDCAE